MNHHEIDAEEVHTTIFPVAMYKVSKEWIDLLFNEIKRTIMTRAIACDCSKQFLADLNELGLTFSNDSTIRVQFPNEPSSSCSTVPTPEPAPTPAAAPVADSAAAPKK